VRMKELSERSGVPVATVKYYLREGLVPAGVATARNQADYGDEHLARLQLIRAMREVADLPVATIARVLQAMESYQPTGRADFLAIAIRELSEPLTPELDEQPEVEAARRMVDALVDSLGWDVDDDSPGRDDLIRSIVAVQRYLPGLLARPGDLAPFARAVRRLAEVELPEGYDPTLDPAGTLRYSVLGTVLFEPVILSLRKLAHVDRQRQLAEARQP
jgi:DNA-binding transcriptional MerR regulator